MLRLAFCSKLDWCYYIISIVKTVSKKIGASLRSVKFLSPEAALHHCPEVATWNCWISYKNACAGLMVLHFLPLLNAWLIVEM